MNLPELDMAWLELPRDKAGFVRRECPRCQRSFKTRPSRHDAGMLQRLLAGYFPFENLHEAYTAEALPAWHCLYCGHRALPDAWLTPEQSAHVERMARAWANHVRYEQLAYVQRTLSHNPRPTFVSVAPEPLPRPLPPDEELLRTLPMVCCGDEVQAQWEWDLPMVCPRCGAHHGGLSGRQQVRLEFVRE
ncbi:hypothetical protein EJ065_3071 [Corallococcus coralloides]|uniref:Uncharacterized protein n=1 Tax=Corallococcus coralloides TaxID=184914 RepID=A0A410RRV0_CORCK|nr:hypothetical protein [Corallococcus coralloides]QAT84639.1 hypothetical protein EJ065_3071 [Corallococcus coralloides]